MASLARRLEELEARRAADAGAEILRRARAASTDNLARFLLALELAKPEATFEEAEAHAWECLGVPMAMVQLADQQTGWAASLGDLLAGRRELWQYMRDRYPAATEQRFGPERTKEVFEKGGST